MSADIDPLWKRIWRTEGIRWLGPRGDGFADAMERFQHGFELGMANALASMVRVLNNERDHEELRGHHTKAELLMAVLSGVVTSDRERLLAVQRDQAIAILRDLWGVVSSIRDDRKMETDGTQFTLQTEEWTDWAREIADQNREKIAILMKEIEGGAK